MNIFFEKVNKINTLDVGVGKCGGIFSSPISDNRFDFDIFAVDI